MNINFDFVPHEYDNDMPRIEKIEHEWNDLMAEIAAAERMRDATIERMNDHISFLHVLADNKKKEWIEAC